jgi:hypothetical protein
MPKPQRADPNAEGGRGLWLVDVLVDELGGTWGFTADGTVAWCVFPVMSQSSYESRDQGSEGQKWVL